MILNILPQKYDNTYIQLETANFARIIVFIIFFYLYRYGIYNILPFLLLSKKNTVKPR